MILNHFTCTEHLPSILADGLNRGDVPTSRSTGENGVWFTTNETPQGHGLRDGVERQATPKELAAMGLPADAPVFWPNKHAVKIKVMIPSRDRLLVPWWKWGRKHCEPAFFDTLNKIGPEYKTWFIYFGTVSPDQFLSVENKVGGQWVSCAERAGDVVEATRENLPALATV